MWSAFEAFAGLFFEIVSQDIRDLWGCRDEEICNAGRYAGCI
jgi:hypothetical protein